MRLSDDQFLSLLREEQGKLLRIAWSITGQEADAWDMVQEASLAAYDNLHRFRGGAAAFDAWIRRILVNRCRNLLKARARMVPLEAVPDAQPGEAPSAEDQVERALLWDEVMQMDDHHRQVLTLRFLVDMTVEEIGTLLELPLGTVKSRLHRAAGALRKRLAEDENPQKGSVNCV